MIDYADDLASLRNDPMTDVRANDLCPRCNQPVPTTSYGSINGKRYCHDAYPEPTCYMRQTWEDARVNQKLPTNHDNQHNKTEALEADA